LLPEQSTSSTIATAKPSFPFDIHPITATFSPYPKEARSKEFSTLTRLKLQLANYAAPTCLSSGAGSEEEALIRVF
jgi:hypothetical protein